MRVAKNLVTSLVVLLAFSGAAPLRAQIAKRNAEVIDSTHTKVFFTLRDSLVLDCYPISGDWYNAGFLLRVNSNEIVGGYHDENYTTIRKGAVLRNEHGKVIGSAACDFDALGFRQTSSYVECGIDWVQVNKTQTYEGSDQEKMISRMLSQGYHRLDQFEPFLKLFSIGNGIDSAGFKDYWQTCGTVVTSSIRFIMVFDHSELFAILSLSPIHYPKTRSRTSVRNELTVSYFTQDKTRIRKFEQAYFPYLEAAD